MEIINLLSIGVASYNFQLHVPSDVPTNGFIKPNTSLSTQQDLNKISQWTKTNKMLLNTKKTNGMIFNFCKDLQFTSRIELESEIMEIVSETKLLGVIVNNNLTWDANTKHLVKKANARMRILHKLVSFSVPREDLLNIYILYIRSILEQSCQVWNSSLTLENIQNLERIQKNALKIILQDSYQDYSNALSITGLKSLVERRNELCFRFAKSCVKNELMKSMFPLNEASDRCNMETRNREKYKVTHCKTKRLQNSAIPFMQNLLNTELQNCKK